MHGVMEDDSFPGIHPLRIDNLETPGDFESAFDSITYRKGACIVRMMHNMLGEETFIRAIRK